MQSVLKVQPGEGRRLWLLLLYSAAFGGGIITVGYRGVGSALFLSRLPTSAAPYLFILPAISITIILLLYNRAAARVRATPLVLVSTTLMFALCILFRVLLETEYATSFEVLAAIYLFTETALSVVAVQLWVIAGQVFDAREARRLFPLVATGGTVASIIAGYGLGPLARLLGVNNLLLVLAASLAVCGACAWALARYMQVPDAGGVVALRAATPGPDATRGGRRPASLLRTVRDIWKAPLLRAIGALIILVSLLINIGWYQLAQALQVNFPGQDEAMLAFLGMFEVWTGIIALLVQFLVTPYVIKRFGLFAALLFFPVATMLFSGVGLAAGGSLLAISAIRGIDPVLRWTINDVATNLLYLPVPADMRQRAKELFGGLYAFAFGLLGVILLLIQSAGGWPYLYWSIPAIGLSLVWLGLIPWTRRQYLSKLTENVTHRRFDFQGATLNITDPDTVRVLADALRKDDEAQVLHALELINGAPGVNWDLYVEPLLAHPSSDVQLQVLRYLGKPGNSRQAETVAALFGAPQERISAAAIESYCAILGSEAAGHISPLLNDARPRVQGAAALGLLRFGDPKVVPAAINTLREMAGSASSTARREASRVIGALALVPAPPDPGVQEILSPLLDDPDPAVRVQAVQAAGALPGPELVPYLLHRLGDNAARQAAIEALAGYGAISLPGLRALLCDKSRDPAVRAHVPAILAKIGSPQAMETLRAALSQENRSLRFAIYRALADLTAGGEANTASGTFTNSLPEADLETLIQSELQECYRLSVMREDLDPERQDLLLQEAIALRVRRSLGGVFDLLAVRHKSARMQHMREALASVEPGMRLHPQALELLDNVVSGPSRDLLIPLIEAPSSQVVDIARRKFSVTRKAPVAWLEDLAVGSDSDTWLQSCVARRVGESVSQSEATRYSALKRGDGEEAMLSTVERVLILKRVPLFGGVPGEELAGVAQLAEEVRFSVGEVMIRQGEPGDCLFVTIDGQTEIVKSGVGQVAVRDAPAVLGEMALVLRQSRSAGCVALTEVLALKLDREPFLELLAQAPGIALAVIEMLAERLDEAQQVGQGQTY